MKGLWAFGPISNLDNGEFCKGVNGPEPNAFERLKANETGER